MFKTKSPVPFIVVTIIVIIIGAVIMIATGGQGVEGHWEFEFQPAERSDREEQQAQSPHARPFRTKMASHVFFTTVVWQCSIPKAQCTGPIRMQPGTLALRRPGRS